MNWMNFQKMIKQFAAKFYSHGCVDSFSCSVLLHHSSLSFEISNSWDIFDMMLRYKYAIVLEITTRSYF